MFRYTFSLFFMFCFNISKVLLLLFVLCVLKSVLTLSNLHWKYQEFLVESVRIMSGMSGIHDRNLEWQPWLRYPFFGREFGSQLYSMLQEGNAPNFLVSNLLKLKITNTRKKVMQYVLLLPLERFLFISKSHGGVTSDWHNRNLCIIWQADL